jgi:hypothetical protein
MLHSAIVVIAVGWAAPPDKPVSVAVNTLDGTASVDDVIGVLVIICLS